MTALAPDRQEATYVDAEQVAKVQADLEAAEQIEVEASRAHIDAMGHFVLEEVSQHEVAASSKALEDAQSNTVALRSALLLLMQRQRAREMQQERDRVDGLRKESEVASATQSKALRALAQSANRVSNALRLVRAQSKVLEGLHLALANADPEKAAEVESDRRDALAQFANAFAAKRGQVREAAARAQYRLQAPNDGTDPVLGEDLVLLGDHVAFSGGRFSAARPAVLDWELSALARLDRDQHAAQTNVWMDHSSRVEMAGLGNLPTSLNEVRSAAGLSVGDVALLIPDQAVTALAALTTFLPASASEGISVRSAPTSALEARQGEARLQEGVEALRQLIAH